MMTQVQLIEPVDDVTIPGPPFAHAAFGSDADTIIVQSNEPAINLFGLGVYFWPEVLGALTFVLVLWAALRCWRVARTPHVPGLPHCRRCGYCLAGLVGDRCSECGTSPSVRRPVVGRSVLRRVGPILTVAGIAAIGYGSLWALQAPRIGWFNRLISIWSVDWYEAARQRNATFLDRLILRAAAPTIRLAEHDGATGELRRVIARLRGTVGANRFVLSKSGDIAWLAGADQNKLLALSVDDGRVLREFDLPSSARGGGGWYQIAGVQADGMIALAAIPDVRRNKMVVVCADGSTGQLTTLFETDVPEVTSANYQGPLPGNFFLVPGSEHRRLIETRIEATPAQDNPSGSRLSTRIVLHEEQGGVWSGRELPRCISMFQKPAFTVDGRFMFACTTFETAGPVRWDLETLEPVGYRRAASVGGSASQSSVHPHYVRDGDRESRWVSSTSGIEYCAVRNRIYSTVRAGRPNGQLQLGVFDGVTLQLMDACPYGRSSRHPAGMHVSPDGRRLMVYMYSETQNSGFDSRLLLFDLR